MEEKVYFKNPDGLKLCGILSNPKEDSNIPMIILCHGFSSSKNASTYLLLQEKLNAHGFATLRFDFFGHGESEGEFADITLSQAVEDVSCALEFLKSKGFSKFGLIGSSFGGNTAILSAARFKELSVLGLRAPVSNYIGHLIAKHSNVGIDEWKKQGFIDYNSGRRGKLKLNYSFFEDAKKHDGFNEALKISIPTIIVHGMVDDIVPFEQSQKLNQIIKHSRLVALPHSNHSFKYEGDREKCVQILVDFIIDRIND